MTVTPCTLPIEMGCVFHDGTSSVGRATDIQGEAMHLCIREAECADALFSLGSGPKRGRFCLPA